MDSRKTAFSKTFALLNNGGTLAMMMTRRDTKSPNEKLWERIQEVYAKEFHPTESYTQRLGYHAAANYGYTDFCEYDFHKERVFTADEYCAFSARHCDHIALPEPYRSRFFEGLKKAINDFGGSITSYETHVLYTAKKPL